MSVEDLLCKMRRAYAAQFHSVVYGTCTFVVLGGTSDVKTRRHGRGSLCRAICEAFSDGLCVCVVALAETRSHGQDRLLAWQPTLPGRLNSAET